MNTAIKKLLEFRNERDWEQFHDSRNLSLALLLEASELNELFLWQKGEGEPDEAKLKEELADVLAYTLLLCARHDLDPEQIVLDKIELNRKKYPADKSKGRSTKYNEL